MRPSDKNSSKHCVLFPQLFAIYYAFAFLLEENLCQICIRNNKKCWSKRLLLHCIWHQNALHLAPKRIAFSTKMHCNLHQNARFLAPKRRQKT